MLGVARLHTSSMNASQRGKNGQPLMREYGSGTVWAIADDLDHLWWSGLFYPADFNNEYAEDVFLNILFYSIGWDLPEDILLVHEVRTGYIRYNQLMALLYSLLEFNIIKFKFSFYRYNRK